MTRRESTTLHVYGARDAKVEDDCCGNFYAEFSANGCNVTIETVDGDRSQAERIVGAINGGSALSDRDAQRLGHATQLLERLADGIKSQADDLQRGGAYTEASIVDQRDWMLRILSVSQRHLQRLSGVEPDDSAPSIGARPELARAHPDSELADAAE